MRKTLCFASRCAKEMLRDKLNLAFGLGFPLIVLLLLSLIQANIPVELFRIDQLAPGVAVFGLSFVSLFSGMLVARDRTSALMLRLFTSPMTAGQFLMGYVLPLIPISLAQSAVCLLVGVCLGLPVSANLLLTLVVLLPAALLFIAFFGYYPILQESFAKIRPKALSWVVRFVIFNAAVAAAYWVIVHVFGITEILEEFGNFGKYSVLVLLAFANVFFVIYDGAVRNITLAYRNWFRPKILKKAR